MTDGVLWLVDVDPRAVRHAEIDQRDHVLAGGLRSPLAFSHRGVVAQDDLSQSQHRRMPA